MKRIFALMLIAAAILSACGPKVTPTISDSEMATKVALILTNMPTPTEVAPKVITATAPSGGTAQPQATQPPAATAVATQAPATAQPPAATSTTGPTATQAATATLSGPTATLAPSTTPVAGDPRTKLGNPSWKDMMANGDNWPTDIDPAGFTSIDFKDGAMVLTGLKTKDGWRLTIDELTNFYLEMTVKPGNCTGNDRYGFIFRVPDNTHPDQGYLAGFTCDGKFSLRKWDGPNNDMSGLLAWKTNAAIKAGANQVNRLGVMVSGSKISLYANGVLLGEASDPSYKSGYFGIFVGAIETTNFTISIDEVDYWIQ